MATLGRESAMPKAVAVWFFLVTLTISTVAQKPTGMERQLMKTAHNSEWAVIPLMYWGEHGGHPEKAGVVGTGFLINDEGYFVTAAHVLAMYEPNQSSQLTAIIRQRTGDGGGRWFEVIERDEAHDLALCRLNVLHLPKSMSDAIKGHPELETPIATLEVSSGTIQTGEFVVLAGFPLGSWNPAIQVGTVAATQTINPNIRGVPAGRRELLQISVAGNMGNSGSPVIELDTGKVIGVIVQAVPAPLFSTVQGPLPLAQNSGIMLAVPADRIRELLNRHGVRSARHTPDEKLK